MQKYIKVDNKLMAEEESKTFDDMSLENDKEANNMWKALIAQKQEDIVEKTREINVMEQKIEKMLELILNTLSYPLPDTLKNDLEATLIEVDPRRYNQFLLTASTRSIEQKENPEITKLLEENIQLQEKCRRCEIACQAHQLNQQIKKEIIETLMQEKEELEKVIQEKNKKQTKIQEDLNKLDQGIECVTAIDGKKPDFGDESLIHKNPQDKLLEEIFELKNKLEEAIKTQNNLVNKNSKLTRDINNLTQEKTLINATINKEKQDLKYQNKKIKQRFDNYKQQNSFITKEHIQIKTKLAEKERQIQNLHKKLKEQMSKQIGFIKENNQQEFMSVKSTQKPITEIQNSMIDDSYGQRNNVRTQKISRELTPLQMFDKVYQNIDDILDSMELKKAIRVGSILTHIINSWKADAVNAVL